MFYTCIQTYDYIYLWHLPIILCLLLSLPIGLRGVGKCGGGGGGRTNGLLLYSYSIEDFNRTALYLAANDTI